MVTVGESFVRNFLEEFGGKTSRFEPLELQLLEHSAQAPLRGVFRARWKGHALERFFGFQCKARWTPRALEQFIAENRALRETKGPVGVGRLGHRAPRHGLLPLVVAPYLNEHELDKLAARGVSGLDLAGNGLFIDPPTLFVWRSGAKNKYTRPPPSQSVYRSWKLTSLVARVFLLTPGFPSVGDVLLACHARMMQREGPLPLTLPTVSKALAQLEEELVVLRKGREIEVGDPVRLLEGLARGYRTPESLEQFTGRTLLSPSEVWSRLKQLRPRVRAVATGRGSASFYTGLAGPERLQLYVNDLKAVVPALDAQPSQAFPNLELVRTEEEGVYFDARERGDAVWSSPVQAYLELASGSAREVDVAGELRVRVLEQLHERSR